MIFSGSSNFTTGGNSGFIFNIFLSFRDLVTVGGPLTSKSSLLTTLLFFSPSLHKPLVIGNWAALERTKGSGFTSAPSVPTTESPLGMVECLEGIVSLSSKVRRLVVPTCESVDG